MPYNTIHDRSKTITEVLLNFSRHLDMPGFSTAKKKEQVLLLPSFSQLIKWNFLTRYLRSSSRAIGYSNISIQSVSLIFAEMEKQTFDETTFAVAHPPEDNIATSQQVAIMTFFYSSLIPVNWCCRHSKAIVPFSMFTSRDRIGWSMVGIFSLCRDTNVTKSISSATSYTKLVSK